jgi:putative ABC transport system permease protein
MHDARLALRALRQNPIFTCVAMTTLALGLGATTAIFSVVNAVLLEPLPIKDPDRVMFLRESRLPQFPSFSISPGNFLTWRREAKTFEAMGAATGGFLILTGQGDPERLRADRVTGDMFPMLGVTPIAGRYFLHSEDQPGGENVTVLSEGLWRRRFGGEPQAIGRSLTLSGKSYTIVGIAPQSVTTILGDSQLWVPMAFDEKEASLYGSHYLRALGRLKPDATVQEAMADLERVALQLEAAFPDSNGGWRVLVNPIHEYLVRNVRGPLIMLSVAVVLVLMIVCANVASLTLARCMSRQRELAVRVALGAGRRGLVRTMLAESLLLSLLSGVAGLGVAAAILGALTALAPASLPRAGDIGLHPEVVVFAVLLCALAPLVFGLVPAVQVSRTDLRESLAAGGRSVRIVLKTRTRAALVVGQISLAILLLVGCTLLVRSFIRLLDVDPGFDPRSAVVVGLQLPSSKYPEPEDRVRFETRLLEQIAGVPGVLAAGFTQSTPLANDFVASLIFEGQPAVPDADRPSANFYSVSPGFFRAMGIRVIRGRGIDERDRAGAPRIAVVNETFARRFYANSDPIGKRIVVTQGPDDWREIVGIVADTRQYGLAERSPSQIYESYQQQPFSSVDIIVRTSGDPAALTSSLRATVQTLDPDQPLGRVITLQQLLDNSVGSQRFSLALISAFAAVALLLASIGLYGLVAYTVSQRTEEIGVRLALGASPADVLRLIMRQALGMAVLGLVIGLAAAIGAARFTRSLLYEISPLDPLTFIVVPLVLLSVIALASLIPARRAARVDPVIAIRGAE